MGTLVLSSEEQILARMIAKFLAESGINDINPGSNLLTLLEAAAREDFAQYIQMLEIIRNYNLDTTTGTDLDNRAFEFGLTRRDAKKATGNVKILRADGFEKVSMSFYTGLPSPIAGDTSINVNDASNVLIGTSGVLIIGRGTSNEEQVSYSVAPVNNTNYWTFTLATPLSNDHGLEETVILKQGSDEVIIAGTQLVVPASGASAQINFVLDQDVTLQAGEAEIDNVNVTCTQAGELGNIPINAISGTGAFSNPPFVGARAQNNAKYTTGRNRETDSQLRDRIKNAIQSLSRGVKSAIKNAIEGLTDPDTAKRVVSANVVLPNNTEEHVLIYIDDGTGFEPSFSAQGFESLLESATGGEVRLQLNHEPLTKANAETNLAEPYNLSAGPTTLIYTVGLQSETITFYPSDFEFPSAVTAEEIVKQINNKSTLLEARTSQSGTKIIVTAKADANEDLQITGGSANAKLAFPTDQRFTLFLYKNDQLLSKDGSTAFVDTGSQETYNFSGLGADPWPLTLIVDGKSANPQTVNFVASDFGNPAAASADEVAAKINDSIAGATATLISNGTKIRLISNTENSSKSKIQVSGGTANSVLNFSTSQVVGRDRDYVLNRFLGMIEFQTPLSPNDSITAASLFTRGFLRTAAPEFYSIVLGETLDVQVDGGSTQTVTFPGTGSLSAAQVAAIINAQITGATASVRNVGGTNYLELTTNSYSLNGSIKVKNTSTASALNFPLETLKTNQRPHRAYVISGNAGPFTILENQNLVVVMDSDPLTKTYTIILSYAGKVTSASSTTVFSNLTYNTIFTSDDSIKNYYLVCKTGANTVSGTVDEITNPGGSTFRYLFSSLPSGLSNITVGDQVTFTNMGEASNNGSFLVTAVNTGGNGYIEITNASGVVEPSGIGGSAKIGQRRQISGYIAASGQITLGSPLSSIPAVNDQFVIIPSTVKNVVDYLNNTKITTLSTKAEVAMAENSTKIQIASKQNGSDGYVQVTGGSANSIFAFSTSINRGLQGYNYYTGLLSLVHKTIYGDDRDLTAFPGVGAAGIDFEVLAPTVQEIPISLTLTLLEGFTLGNVEDEIRSAITAYVNGLGVGDDVVLAEIVNAVMSIDGIYDVEIQSPTVNQVIADNEIARTRSNLIDLG